jgi:hypothetical protein
MSIAESACYTLINVSDTEPYNEMQIKQDLGKFNFSANFSIENLM